MPTLTICTNYTTHFIFNSAPVETALVLCCLIQLQKPSNRTSQWYLCLISAICYSLKRALAFTTLSLFTKYYHQRDALTVVSKATLFKSHELQERTSWGCRIIGEKKTRDRRREEGGREGKELVRQYFCMREYSKCSCGGLLLRRWHLLKRWTKWFPWLEHKHSAEENWVWINIS